MAKYILTQDALDDPRNNDTVIMSGFALNDPAGLFMNCDGGVLRWVLIVMLGGRWAVYCASSDHDPEYVSRHGDKVSLKFNIENIIEFSDDMWKMYNH